MNERPSKGETSGSALSGVRVLELAEGVAGPHCGRFLAALGAEVVKIERPPNGDWARGVGPFLKGLPSGENSSLFAYNNPGKESVLYDWGSERGLKFVESLVADFDILIEDWDLQLRRSLHISRDSFTNLNKELIELSVTPYGLSGPYSEWRSSPIIQLALGGFLYLTGNPGQEPLMLPGHQPDYLTGLNGSNAVHIALWEGDRSGEGQFLEVSMLETLATLHQFTMEMETFEGILRTRNGNQWQKQSSFASYGITTLPCSDGYICFGISAEDQWERLCAMIGREDLITDTEFNTRIKRANNSDFLDELLTDWIAGRTRKEVFMETSEFWSLPTAPILDMSEVLKDPQFIYRDMFKSADTYTDSGAIFPTFPFKSTGLTTSLGPLPFLGQHTEEFLGRYT